MYGSEHIDKQNDLITSSEWSRLEEVANVIDSLHKTPTYSEFGLPMVRATDVRYGNLNLTQSIKVNENTFMEFSRRYKPTLNDIIITRVGVNYGTTTRVKNTGFCLGQNIAAIVPKKINPRYLYAVLNSKLIWEQIKAGTVGSTQATLSLKAINALKIPRFDKNSEDTIATILGALDDRITLLRETNATLEAIAQALFKSWFVDFDPVHAKQQGRLPEGMDEKTAALFPDSFEESVVGLVPAGWNCVSLREVVSIFDSQRIPLAGQERAKRKGEYPYYGAAALMDYVDDYIFDGVFLLTGEDGSVANSNGYPITQYVWGKIWVNNHAHVLQGKDGVSTEHLMMFLKRTNIEPFITGAVQAKLSQSNMWRIMFLKPPRPISERFGSVIEPLFAKLRHNAEQIRTLADLRDTLLPRLISGQLRVGI